MSLEIMAGLAAVILICCVVWWLLHLRRERFSRAMWPSERPSAVIHVPKGMTQEQIDDLGRRLRDGISSIDVRVSAEEMEKNLLRLRAKQMHEIPLKYYPPED